MVGIGRLEREVEQRLERAHRLLAKGDRQTAVYHARKVLESRHATEGQRREAERILESVEGRR